MRRTLSSAVRLLMALSFPAYSPGQSGGAAAAASRIELQISGPRVIRIGQDLHFTVTLVNRSSTSVALMFYHDGEAVSSLQWKITDSSDRELPPPLPKGTQGVCLVSGAQPEEAIRVLEPGEQFAYAIPEDPSNQFAFRGKAFYKVTVTYAFDPAAVFSVKDVGEAHRGSAAAGGIYPKRELLLKTPRMTVTSNVWTMYLAD
jgi:hypothetical protein